MEHSKNFSTEVFVQQELSTITEEEKAQHHGKIQNIFRKVACKNEIFRIVAACFREDYIKSSDTMVFKLALSNKSSLSICDVRTAMLCIYNTFEETELADAQLYLSNNGVDIQLDHPTQLLEILKSIFEKNLPGTTNPYWERFLHFSEAAIAHETLAIEEKRRFNADLIGICKIGGHASLWEYLASTKSIDYLQFFNRSCSFLGHPLMPFSKLKSVLSETEIINYSPEFAKDVPLTLAAISRTCASYTIYEDGGDLHSYYKECLSEAYNKWRQALQSLNLNADDYFPFPLHPLNKKIAAIELSRLIEDKQFIMLEDVSIITQAGLSFRTMLPKGSNIFHIKVPIPIQLTSIVRGIGLHELRGTVILSKCVQMLAEANENYGQTFYLAPELATVCVKQQDQYELSDKHPRKFCYLLRENLQKHIKDDEICVIAAGLFVISPVTKKPLFIEIIEKSGVSDETSAIEYFKDYVQTILHPILSMLCKEGYVLEAHQQNMTLVFKKSGRLQRFFYHEAAASDLYIPLFKYSELCKMIPEEIVKKHAFVVNNATDIVRIFSHSSLWVNLYPLAYILSRQYNSEVGVFIKVIHNVIEAEFSKNKSAMTRQEMSSHLERIQAIEEIEHSLLQESLVEVIRLFGKLYLQSQVKGWQELNHQNPSFAEPHALIDNPLTQWKKEKQMTDSLKKEPAFPKEVQDSLNESNKTTVEEKEVINSISSYCLFEIRKSITEHTSMRRFDIFRRALYCK